MRICKESKIEKIRAHTPTHPRGGLHPAVLAAAAAWQVKNANEAKPPCQN